MSLTSIDLPLNENDELRAATRRPSICPSALMISSEMPSLKNSFSASALKLANGNTAIEGASLTGVMSACASAAWTSSIVRYRWPGCFARHFCTIDESVDEGRRGGGSSRSTALNTCPTVVPLKGRVPDSISYRTAPKLKMSDLASRGCPAACSGDMYATVPTTAPAFVKVTPGSAFIDFASPKSSTLAPAAVTITFPGLRSRCRMPWRWASATAPAI
jgi:hypothetical protein